MPVKLFGLVELGQQRQTHLNIQPINLPERRVLPRDLIVEKLEAFSCCERLMKAHRDAIGNGRGTSDATEIVKDSRLQKNFQRFITS